MHRLGKRRHRGGLLGGMEAGARRGVAPRRHIAGHGVGRGDELYKVGLLSLRRARSRPRRKRRHAGAAPARDEEQRVDAPR